MFVEVSVTLVLRYEIINKMGISENDKILIKEGGGHIEQLLM